jgi:transposase
VTAAAEQRCPCCGAALRERQRWCLACGAAALTAIATPRRWASTGVAALLLGALALAGIGYALAALIAS